MFVKCLEVYNCHDNHDISVSRHSPLEKTGVCPVSCSSTLAARVSLSPLSPTQMFRQSLRMRSSLMGFSFFSPWSCGIQSRGFFIVELWSRTPYTTETRPRLEAWHLVNCWCHVELASVSLLSGQHKQGSHNGSKITTLSTTFTNDSLSSLQTVEDLVTLPTHSDHYTPAPGHVRTYPGSEASFHIQWICNAWHIKMSILTTLTRLSTATVSRRNNIVDYNGRVPPQVTGRYYFN